jgi:N-acetylmuramic acid 6-phosphate etherase
MAEDASLEVAANQPRLEAVDTVSLATEASNPASRNLDQLSASQIVELMNEEDGKVAGAVRKTLPQIAQAVEVITARMQKGGRLIYMGAGTSGRLGVLDAAECPPTFNTSPDQVLGLIAGGPNAMVNAAEAAEDDPALGRQDAAAIGLTENDIVVGLAASGRTPYVVGALQYAREVGAAAIAVTCNSPSALEEVAEITIAPVTGPEVLTGSTRLKAGTAQKMVLNMLSTATMVRLGKTYGNLMVDMRPTNAKLRRRAARIVAEATGQDEMAAMEALEASGGETRTAIVALLAGVTPDEARERLRQANGFVRKALEA